jgi:hypothetical protein
MDGAPGMLRLAGPGYHGIQDRIGGGSRDGISRGRAGRMLSGICGAGRGADATDQVVDAATKLGRDEERDEDRRVSASV